MRRHTSIYIAFRRLLPVNHANLSKSATFDPKAQKNAPRRISASGPCKHTCLGKIAPSTYARIISRHVFTSTPLPLRHSPYKTWARRRRSACNRTQSSRARHRCRPFGTCAPVPVRLDPPMPKASPSGQGDRRPQSPSHAACTTIRTSCGLGGTPLRGVRRRRPIGGAHSQSSFLPPLTATVTPRNRRSSRLRI